jgi:spore cortex formation protein SpoVR/YcgB (stage V sporulation)
MRVNYVDPIDPGVWNLGSSRIITGYGNVDSFFQGSRKFGGGSCKTRTRKGFGMLANTWNKVSPFIEQIGKTAVEKVLSGVSGKNIKFEKKMKKVGGGDGKVKRRSKPDIFELAYKRNKKSL